MAHATSRGAYRQLTDRLNRFPQGAPPSELLEDVPELRNTPVRRPFHSREHRARVDRPR